MHLGDDSTAARAAHANSWREKGRRANGGGGKQKSSDIVSVSVGGNSTPPKEVVQSVDQQEGPRRAVSNKINSGRTRTTTHYRGRNKRNVALLHLKTKGRKGS